MVRLITTNCIDIDEDKESYCSAEIDISNLIKIFTYFHFEEHIAFVKEKDLKDTLYSLNLVSRTHLASEKFLIYINDYEYSICFNHKTIYSLKIGGNFKLNDIIKSVLITKNLIMLLSAGEVHKVFFIIDSQYEELYKNILKENLKNDKGEYIVEKLGDVNQLVKKLPELETKRAFLFKYITLSILIFLSIYLTFDGLDSISKNNFQIHDTDKITFQIEAEKMKLMKNKENLKNQSEKYSTLSNPLAKEAK